MYIRRGCKRRALHVPSNPVRSGNSDFISHSLSQHPAVHTRRHLQLPHSRILYTRCTRARSPNRIYAYINMNIHKHIRNTMARARVHSQIRGSPPICTTSWKLGTASDMLVSPGLIGGESRRITRRKEYKPRGARRKTGHSRLLSGFGWLGYLHLPKFTGGQCLAHFYGSITGTMS